MWGVLLPARERLSYYPCSPRGGGQCLRFRPDRPEAAGAVHKRDLHRVRQFPVKISCGRSQIPAYDSTHIGRRNNAEVARGTQPHKPVERIDKLFYKNGVPQSGERLRSCQISDESAEEILTLQRKITSGDLRKIEQVVLIVNGGKCELRHRNPCWTSSGQKGATYLHRWTTPRCGIHSVRLSWVAGLLGMTPASCLSSFVVIDARAVATLSGGPIRPFEHRRAPESLRVEERTQSG